MAVNLKGYTHNCTISILDLYEKVKRNAPDLRPPTKAEQIEIAKEFAKSWIMVGNMLYYKMLWVIKIKFRKETRKLIC